MEDILSLIDKLPYIISYIIYGCLFLSIFNFIKFKNNETDIKHYFISCITVNFIIKATFDGILQFCSIYTNNSSVEYYLSCLAFTIVTAFISGKIVSSKAINSLLLKVGIQRTVNQDIWNDILQDYTKLYIHLKGKDYAYIGYHKYSEGNCSNPKIVLSHYQLRRLSTGEIVTDYSDDDNRCIMIGTKDVDIVEIIYDDDEPTIISKIQQKLSKKEQDE